MSRKTMTPKKPTPKKRSSKPKRVTVQIKKGEMHERVLLLLSMLEGDVKKLRSDLATYQYLFRGEYRAENRSFFWLVRAMQEYGTCRCCGQPVADEVFRWAVKRFEQQLCSDECRRKEHIRQHACCSKATPSPCVCMYSFTCPEHGTMHIGTHD
jgi:hypothetical protein